MTRRCDRCGASVVDVVGQRQASLFDVPEASPLATPEAKAELRTGRVLCPACQRSGELFEAELAAWNGSIEAKGKAEAEEHAEAALRADAVREMDGGQTFDLGESTIRTTLEPFPVEPSENVRTANRRRYRRRDWRGDANAEAWDRARGSR